MSAVKTYNYDDDGRIRNIPVLSPRTLEHFVNDRADVEPWRVSVDGNEVLTGAIRIGAQFDLLGIALTDDLVASGTVDSSDALEPSPTIESLFIEATYPDGRTSVKRYDTIERYPSASTAPAQDSYRVEVLDFNSNRLASENGNSRLEFRLTGRISLMTGDCVVNASSVTAVPDEGIRYEVIGYVLASYRINRDQRAGWHYLKEHLNNVGQNAPIYLADVIPGLTAEQIRTAAQRHAAQQWFERGGYVRRTRASSPPIAVPTPELQAEWLAKAGFNFTFEAGK